MQINLTLVVQGTNFLIAHWMISKFFFRPVVAIVQADKRANEQLVASIDKEAAFAHQLEKKKKERWAVLRKDFAQRVPNLGARVAVFIPQDMPAYESVPPDDTTVERLKNEVRDAMVERLSDVR